MYEPIVSVIVTTKNEEAHIRSLLESIKKQTYKNIQIIVVDASSKDRTHEICLEYTDYVLQQPNRGVNATGEAKNMALGIAQGSYLAFQAAGCAWHPEFIARAVASLENHPNTPILFAAWNVIDINGEITRIQPLKKWDTRRSAIENFVLNGDLDVQSMLVRKDRMISWMPLGRNDDLNFLYRFLYQYPHPLVVQYEANTYDRSYEKRWGGYAYGDAAQFVSAVMVKFHTLHELKYPLDSIFFRYLALPAQSVEYEWSNLYANILAKCMARFVEQVAAHRTLADMEYFSNVTTESKDYFFSTMTGHIEGK